MRSQSSFGQYVCHLQEAMFEKNTYDSKAHDVAERPVDVVCEVVVVVEGAAEMVNVLLLTMTGSIEERRGLISEAKAHASDESWASDSPRRSE